MNQRQQESGKVIRYTQHEPASTGRNAIRLGALMVIIPGLLGQAPEGSAGKRESAIQGKHERRMQIYTRDAEGYTVYRDTSRQEKLELQPKPVYVWTNPLRAGGQDGAVFVWTCRGCADLLGTIFSYPATGKRSIQHELHSLATTVLDVSRQGSPASGGEAWTPKVPGITLAPIPGAAAPAKTPGQRLVEMRRLAREFSGTAADEHNNRWELRMLPQPFFRYESTDPEVLDGAVFAFVSSAGTDPEAILVLEAGKARGASKPVWQFGLARFSDMSLKMRCQGKEVFSAPQLLKAPEPDGAYRIFLDRVIPPIDDETKGTSP